uniref:Alpha/beta hydrolase fold-3 domain-containing protein n=1 Tax=Quercus lobata TaxID=97700 RepID=A0A7N2MNB5_QUELO
MTSTTKEVPIELLPFIRVYKNGSVERLEDTPIVPPSPDQDPETGVSSKDNHFREPFHLSSPLPPKTHCSQPKPKAPHLSLLPRRRLAPEHLLPAAYEDCWAALQWVASHSAGNGKEPWLINNGDFERIFIGGDSAGANIVHNMAIRAGIESLPCGAKILGAYLAHSYFWSSKPIGAEPKEGHEKSLPYLFWKFVYPSVTGSVDNPMVNPEGYGKEEWLGRI